MQGDHSRDRSVNYRKSLRLISFDCGAQTQRLLSFITYDSYGKVTASETQPDLTYAGYDAIVPESVGEAEFKVACRQLTNSPLNSSHAILKERRDRLDRKP